MPGPSRIRALIWFGIPTILILVVVLVSGLVWEGRTITRLQEKIAALSRENGDLLRRVGDLTRSQPAAASALPVPAAVRAPRPGEDAAMAEALASSEQQLRHLRDSLTQTTAETSHLQTKVGELEARLENETAENHRLSAALDDGRSNLDSANQALDALRGEVKANSTRVAELDRLNSRLKEENAARKQSSEQTQQTISDLEGILRRREMYLNNILRRYKEITEQYRGISAVRDGRDRETSPVSTAEISRIQNSIALAEEDLKQISVLSAQAERLQKKLPSR